CKKGGHYQGESLLPGVGVCAPGIYHGPGGLQVHSEHPDHGRRGSSRKPVLNRELWLELEGAAVQHKVNRTWVRGHSPNQDQNRAHSLARQAAMAGAA
ncbi:MAG: RNase H family protein, partial [Terriglobia bacterium]